MAWNENVLNLMNERNINQNQLSQLSGINESSISRYLHSGQKPRCEFDDSHVTFTAKRTGHPYMEGHHAVPMKYQDKFEHSLDVYANVVCLCPIYHRLLHYSVESEKENVVIKYIMIELID